MSESEDPSEVELDECAESQEDPDKESQSDDADAEEEDQEEDSESNEEENSNLQNTGCSVLEWKCLTHDHRMELPKAEVEILAPIVDSFTKHSSDLQHVIT